MPPMVWGAVPSKTKVLVPALKVPLWFVKFPRSLWVKEPPLNVVFGPKEALPFTVMSLAAVAATDIRTAKSPTTVNAPVGMVLTPLVSSVKLP